MSLDLVDINHLKTALSNFLYFPVLKFFHFKLIPGENAATNFSLFAGKGHVEIVFLGTPNNRATIDLGCSFSICFNTLNLTSMGVHFFCCDFGTSHPLF